IGSGVEKGLQRKPSWNERPGKAGPEIDGGYPVVGAALQTLEEISTQREIAIPVHDLLAGPAIELIPADKAAAVGVVLATPDRRQFGLITGEVLGKRAAAQVTEFGPEEMQVETASLFIVEEIIGDKIGPVEIGCLLQLHQGLIRIQDTVVPDEQAQLVQVAEAVLPHQGVKKRIGRFADVPIQIVFADEKGLPLEAAFHGASGIVFGKDQPDRRSDLIIPAEEHVAVAVGPANGRKAGSADRQLNLLKMRRGIEGPDERTGAVELAAVGSV